MPIARPLSQRVLRSVLPAALGAAVLACSAATAAVPERPRTGPGATAVAARADGSGHAATLAAMRRIVASGVPGALAEVREGNRSWYGAAGTADVTRPRLPRPGDRFRIGESTELFVATAVLQLEAEGRLGLDDTVEHWLPGLVTGHGHDGGRITVRQLLGHTSGIFDYTRDAGFDRRFRGREFTRHRYDVHTPRELVRTAMAHAPRFAPGSGWGHSHTDYVLAGMIVEKAAGRPYAKEIEERILVPLGLRSTTLPGGEVTVPAPSSRGYGAVHGAGAQQPDDVTEFSSTALGAAGEMISSAGDLDVFLRALLGGHLLPARQSAEMLTTVATGTDGIAQGLGIVERRLSCGTTVRGGTGSVPGAVSLVFATAGAEHTASFDLNSSAPAAGNTLLLEAEFCGRSTAAQ
ncbi:serine hydrolase domain-containing protein [Streptomyces gamaensis]|uniref:Serine hydrolase domain-containing protein n=1 Tax=Streptomyces gamaensis TaxID=1763542 RepID=A0ABW0Z0R9_9ACTN